LWFKPSWANSSQDPIKKILNTKKGLAESQVVECLPSKHEAQSSDSSTTKNRKKKKLSKHGGLFHGFVFEPNACFNMIDM
jgi:hypothetical protein